MGWFIAMSWCQRLLSRGDKARVVMDLQTSSMECEFRILGLI